MEEAAAAHIDHEVGECQGCAYGVGRGRPPVHGGVGVGRLGLAGHAELEHGCAEQLRGGGEVLKQIGSPVLVAVDDDRLGWADPAQLQLPDHESSGSAEQPRTAGAHPASG
jgi:hypothetical protein